MISQKGKIVADQSVSFNADVYCIYEDKDHNIWMGTREDGLFFIPFSRGGQLSGNLLPA